MLDPVEQIHQAVKHAGGKTYLVGGSVRDGLLGVESKDQDLMVTGISIDRLSRILPGKKDVVGASFGVIKVTIGDETIDVALPRTERSFGVGHKEFEITADPLEISIEQDALRRDLTINSLYYDLDSKTIIDPTGGRQDLEDHILRAVGEPRERFEEDPLRLLRCARFVAKTGFDIEPDTFQAIQDNVDLIATVAPERIAEELTRLLAYPDSDYVLKALRYLRDSGLFEVIFPEFADSFNFDQQNPHHYLTVDDHVFEAVRHAVERGASIRARWATLLHDVGKPATFTFDGEKGRFFGHEDVGAEIANKWMRKLRFPNDETAAITLIIADHLNPPHDASDKALRRYVAKLGEGVWQDALMTREADLAAHKLDYDPIEWADSIRARIANMGGEVAGFTQHRLALSGGDIAKTFGVKGKTLGDYKEAATAAVIDGLVPNETQALLDWLAFQKSEGLL